jgi:hypothetical protein
MSNDPHRASSDAEQEPPDQGSAGDVSTTGHSDHDVDRHGGHGGHGDDDAAAAAAEVPTLVPTTWRQLILPAIILIVVAILLAGPVMNAFAPQPASAPPTTEEQHNNGTEGEAQTTPEAGGEEATPTSAPTSTPQALATEVPSTPTAVALAPLIATQTAVAQLGEQGEVGRVPVQLEFGGATFKVNPGSGLLPDWKPSQEEGTATWIDGTVANHILYVPFNAANEGLFKAAKSGDILKLTMNTGQVFNFSVNRSERAVNGPPAKEGDFTVSVAMTQDHAGVTLFLIGDPAPDRAVVQADFTGDIQSTVLP